VNGDLLNFTYGISGDELACFRKQIDCLQFGPLRFENIHLDFSTIEGFNGLIGLDLLLAAEAVLDLKQQLLHVCL
jgi:hypothetical protein